MRDVNMGAGSGVIDPNRGANYTNQAGPPLRSIARSLAYKAIDTERDYQDAGKGNAARHEEKKMTVGEFICCMDEYISKARAEWVKAGGVPASLHDIRKVAGLAVQCMELHGAPLRQ